MEHFTIPKIITIHVEEIHLMKIAVKNVLQIDILGNT